MDLHLQIQPRHIEQDGGLLHVIGADQTDVFPQRGDDSVKLFSTRQHFNSLLCSRPRCCRNPELSWDNLGVKSQNLAHRTVDVRGGNFVQRVAGRSIIEVSFRCRRWNASMAVAKQADSPAKPARTKPLPESLISSPKLRLE